MDKQRVCCFTGHRNITEKDLPLLIRRLDEIIAELISQGVVFYGSGMALGFDVLAADAVLTAQKSNPAVRLIAVLPCTNQDQRWNYEDKQKYRELLAAADKISFVSDKPYHDGCMAARNRHLVERSGICVAYMKHERSGTAQTMRMAKEQGLKIVNLAETLRMGGE